MSGLTAKIVSTWLTETDERGLQAAFCHWLISQGAKVIHSTNHNAMEMGKDVIALWADGTLAAYQLKAYKGTHLTMGEFRSEVQPQLRDLCENAVVYPGIVPRRPDRAGVVANSDFHEHVQREVDDFNRASGGGRAPLSLIGRSQLLSDFVGLTDILIPDDVALSKSILQVLLDDGAGEFPIETFAPVLEKIVDDHITSETAMAEVRRTASKLSMITEVVAGPWRRKNNHLGVLQAYSVCLMASCLAVSRTNRLAECRDVLDLQFGLCAHMLREFHRESKDFTVAHITRTGEYDNIGRAKVTHVMALSALSAFLDSEGGASSAPESRSASLALIGRLKGNRFIWGEAAFIHGLAICIFLERYATGKVGDEFWSWLIQTAVGIGSLGTPLHFMPWQTLDEENSQLLLGLKKHEYRTTTSSYWCDPLILAGVRLNLRSTIKSVWPMAVEIGHRKFTPEIAIDVFRFHCDKGTEETIARPLPVGWTKLKSEIASMPAPSGIFAERPLWYLLMLMVYPHRIRSDLLVPLLPRLCDGTWH